VQRKEAQVQRVSLRDEEGEASACDRATKGIARGEAGTP